ncbi:heavy-metal-associated domain-containing protein [Psychroserpens sp. Hel_I_66]|uniref:heavy-metal-associated domain-containing protein n=1 Tax=Psychroserpens sp. Hel_I_66 TaxID=1250004 RepID=UPI0006461782|nr:heavy metal-associated domain-containing protein [Psychroserpens sp. Hel_I_66]
MKTLKNIFAIALISVSIVACKSDKDPEVITVESTSQINTNAAKKLDPNATYAKAEFGIEGMTCAMGCAKTIEKKMARMDGVKSAKVDFDKQIAMVEYDEAMVTPKTLEEAVSKAGDTYKVKDMKTVESFSTEKEACKANCDKACCAEKSEDSKKMACAEDCKKDCCSKKA